MITGPEIARMLSSLDETLNDYGKSTELYSHHEKTTSLENMFEKVGNSFLKDIEILYTCYETNLQTNMFMRLELLEQNSILHTKREILFSEAKV